MPDGRRYTGWSTFEQVRTPRRSNRRSRMPPLGRFLLTAVALGFVAFGVFAILQSRCRRMQSFPGRSSRGASGGPLGHSRNRTRKRCASEFLGPR